MTARTCPTCGDEFTADDWQQAEAAVQLHINVNHRGDFLAAVAALDSIAPDARGNGDPEGMHYAADNVLLACVPKAVADAYDRVVERAGSWWFA